MDSMALITIVSCIIVFAYSFLAFCLIKSMLKTSKYKNFIVPVSIFNALLLILMYCFVSKITIFLYVIIFVMLLVEFLIIFKDTFKRTFFVTSALVIHIMSFVSFFIAIIAIITNRSIYNIVVDQKFFLMVAMITLAFLCVMLLVVIKAIPSNKLRIILQYDQQLNYLILLISVLNVYMLIKSAFLPIETYSKYPYIGQIAISLVVMTCAYLFLFYTFRTSEMLDYKEINEDLEQKINNEKQIRASMTSDSIASYEYNLTKDKLIMGLDYFENKFDYKGVDNYSTIKKYMADNYIYKDDYELYWTYSSPQKLLSDFNQNKREVSFEYRRRDENNNYIWVNSSTIMVKDAKTGDIICYNYIKNIDEQKKVQLELRYKAERDSLTGLYNQGTSKKLIEEFVKQNTDENIMAAFFIIDIDNFKAINDHLGHTFGDVVLSELSEKLLNVFRKDDIVGRIGGDEFVAFIKNCTGLELIGKKAMQICASFLNSYKGNNDKEYMVSASIGIAVYPNHGSTMEELYKNSDVALYNAKNKGKNTYSIYNGEEFSEYKNSRTEIDSMGMLPQKRFKKNRAEYVFKMLYGSENSLTAVGTVLKLTADHFDFSRGYIFETSEDGQYISNTFEWCAKGIDSQMKELQDLPIKVVKTAYNNFNKTGMFILRDIALLNPDERAVLEPQNIKSMLQFAMYERQKIIGLIGFDDCINQRIPMDEEIEEISTICNILSTFIIKQKSVEKANRSALSLSAVMNNLDSYAYVVDKDTRMVLFANQKTVSNSQCNPYGEFCYKSIKFKTKPCEDCPIEMLSEDIDARVSYDCYDENLNEWLEVNASNINWLDGKNACLISCINITKYKNM